jgi:hypothetical protein
MTWKACERFNIIPPGITGNRWEDLSVGEQADLIAFNQIRDYEDDLAKNEDLKVLLGSRVGR